jgi:hypothetical protein
MPTHTFSATAAPGTASSGFLRRREGCQFPSFAWCLYSVLRRNLEPCHRRTTLAIAPRIGAVTPPAKEGHGGREGFGAAHPSRSMLVDHPLGRDPSTPFPPRNRSSRRWFACSGVTCMHAARSRLIRGWRDGVRQHGNDLLQRG